MRTMLKGIRARISGNHAANLTVWLLFAQVMAAGVSFVVNIVAAYGLSPEQRGLLAFYLQVGYLLTTFVMLGNEKPFIAQFRGNFATATARLLQIIRPSYGIIAAGLLTTVLLYVFDRQAVAIPLALVIVFVIANQHLRILRAAYITSGTLRPFFTVVFVTNGLTLVFALVLAALGQRNFLIWLLAYVVANLIATVVVARAVFRSDGQQPAADVPVAQMRRLGLKLLPGSLGNITMFRPDRLLLPVLANPAALGLYIVISGALEIAVWPIQQWSDSKMRQWHQRKPLSEPGLRATILLKAALGVLVISVVCALVLVGVVIWILPDDYNASLHLLVPITVANIVYGTTRVQQGITIAGNLPGLVSIAEVIGLVVSVGAYFVLIPMWGSLGAAIGSIIGNTVCFAAGEIGLLRNRKNKAA